MPAVKLKVLGRRDSYLKFTLSSWLNELSSFLRGELGTEVEVVEEECELDVPVLCLDDKVVLVGLPSEEGYLIEALKKVLKAAQGNEPF
ncbi:MAG: hypothetical protein N3H31_04580 [Candidatus Nezhaarchaeota archaeon]|nr:hypothetical protein [Candidatus Nezhaarchaeota archaeon]